jgi:uncharacterized protein (UPF0264 family)
MHVIHETLQLLVSVRDAPEAEMAVQGGADWIDIKEPRRGSLGRPTVAAMSAVVQAVAGRRPLSVALGELGEWNAGGRGAVEIPLGISRAKVGLSTCSNVRNWPDRLTRLAGKLPPGVALVAVQYADWQSCGAPSPAALLKVARQLECKTLLIDTFHKARGTLLDYFSPSMLESVVTAAADQGMTTVAAGGLRPNAFIQVCRAGADVVAVRGAACEQNCRNSGISMLRVRELRRRLDLLRRAAESVKNS